MRFRRFFGIAVGLAAVSCQPNKPVMATATPTQTATTVATSTSLACPAGTAERSESTTAVWCERPDGLRHGPYLERYPDGAPRTRGQHADGVRDGEWIGLWTDGTNRSIEHWARGKPTGTWITFFADGRHATESLHREDGSVAFRSFRPDGTKHRQGMLVGGVERGEWTEWDAAGVASTTRYGDGAKPTTGLALIGIPECDDYIAKFDRCVREKVPEPARSQMSASIQLAVKAWTDAAAGPAREGLVGACKAALDAARTAMDSMGCTW